MLVTSTFTLAAAAATLLASGSNADMTAPANLTAEANAFTLTYDFTLRPGQLVFTDPADTPLVGVPNGSFAITGTPSFKIIDAATGKHVGLDEVYVVRVSSEASKLCSSKKL